MGVTDALAPAKNILGNGFKSAIGGVIPWIFLSILVIIVIVVVVKNIIQKKKQWTHKLRVRRVGQNGFMEEPFYINMRRFPLIKGAEIFELENALLGSFLMPSLDEYTGMNEFSIVLDKNNRIYTNTGEKWCPNKKSAEVSGQHSEIDIARGRLKDDWQKVNKVSDRIEWSTIAKYAFLGIVVIAIVILGVTGLQKWVEAKEAETKQSEAFASALDSLTDIMETNEAIVNTQKLQIVPMLKALYGTDNLQSILDEELSTEINNETS